MACLCMYSYYLVRLYYIVAMHRFETLHFWSRRLFQTHHPAAYTYFASCYDYH
jgi:hypothetical protein